MGLGDITIKRGRTGEIIVNVTGIPDWRDLAAKFYATDKYGNTPMIEILGEITPESNSIKFIIGSLQTASLLASQLLYEVVVYSDDSAFVKTVKSGTLAIEEVIKVNPNE